MSNSKHMIRFFTFENYHGKRDVGSTRLRAHNLIKYWSEAELYKYGEHPDVLIFQKVYVTFDYKFPINYPEIKILDICDADWKDSPDIFVKETLDAMDAVVTPTESLRDYLQQMTDTPCRVIKDRFDISEFPSPKKHTGRAKKAVWFGYSHNVDTLKYAVPSLERLGLDLIIISDHDPMAYKWARGSEYEKKYKYIKYEHPPYKELQKADICILPEGKRPFDYFKSENKTIIAELCGVPVVKDIESLEKMRDGEARQEHIDKVYGNIKEEYNCVKSIEEYKRLIDEIKRTKTQS